MSDTAFTLWMLLAIALLTAGFIWLASVIGTALGMPTVVAFIGICYIAQIVFISARVGKRREPITGGEAAGTALSNLAMLTWLLVVFL